MNEIGRKLKPGRRISVHYEGADKAECLFTGFFIAADETGIMVKPLASRPTNFVFFPPQRVIYIEASDA